MKTITMVIEAGKDLFSAYPRDGGGIYGAGATVEECKRNVLDCIEFAKEDPEARVSDALTGDFEIAWAYDTESFLRHYKGILTNAGLERLTGIHQKQLQGYSSGERRPRPEQRRKIQAALHRLGAELQAVELA